MLKCADQNLIETITNSALQDASSPTIQNIVSILLVNQESDFKTRKYGFILEKLYGGGLPDKELSGKTYIKAVFRICFILIRIRFRE